MLSRWDRIWLFLLLGAILGGIIKINLHMEKVGSVDLPKVEKGGLDHE